jgi:hypothetical protein
MDRRVSVLLEQATGHAILLYPYHFTTIAQDKDQRLQTSGYTQCINDHAYRMISTGRPTGRTLRQTTWSAASPNWATLCITVSKVILVFAAQRQRCALPVSKLTVVMPNIRRMLLSDRTKEHFSTPTNSAIRTRAPHYYMSADEFGWPDAGQRILIFNGSDDRGHEATSASQNAAEVGRV